MKAEGSGRLEKQITVLVDTKILEQIETIVADKNIDKSELVRRLLKIGYEAFTEDPENRHPLSHEIISRLYANIINTKNISGAIEMAQNARKRQKNFEKRLRAVERDIHAIEARFEKWGITKYEAPNPQGQSEMQVDN